MVDIADVEKVSALAIEANQINRAITILTDGAAKIVRMAMQSPPPPDGNGDAVSIDTSHILYPEQMVTGIVTQLWARLDAIHQELQTLGVTGVNEQGGR